MKYKLTMKDRLAGLTILLLDKMNWLGLRHMKFKLIILVFQILDMMKWAGLSLLALIIISLFMHFVEQI